MIVFVNEKNELEIMKEFKFDYKNFNYEETDLEMFLKNENNYEKEKMELKNGLFEKIYNYVCEKYDYEINEIFENIKINKENLLLKNIKFILKLVLKEKKMDLEFYENVEKKLK